MVKPEIENKSCLGLGGSLSLLVIFGTERCGKDKLIAWDHSFVPTKAFPLGMCVRERS